jgi:protein-tyrosine phosphatase
MEARPHENTYWVNEHFLAGEYPGNWDDERAAERIRAYLAAGVTYFIDLTSETDGLRPYQPILDIESEGKVIYQRLPIQDLGVPEVDFMVKILDCIDGAIADGHTVYAHCWGGIGRTGTVVGCYLARHGTNGSIALRQLAEMFATMEKAQLVFRSPETDEQIQFIRDWPVGQ